MYIRIIWIILMVLLFAIFRQTVLAQDDQNLSVQNLAQRVSALETKENQLLEIARDSGGTAVVLFGAFCALWAQNTNRNPWLWFFMGLFFSVITVIVLLVKNSRDRGAVTHPSY